MITKLWDKIKKKIVTFLYRLFVSFVLFSVLVQLVHIIYHSICNGPDWIKKNKNFSEICEYIDNVLTELPFKIAKLTGPAGPFILVVLLPYWLLLRKEHNGVFVKDAISHLKMAIPAIAFMASIFIWLRISDKYIVPKVDYAHHNTVRYLPIVLIPFILFILCLIFNDFFDKCLNSFYKLAIYPIIKSFKDIFISLIKFIPEDIRNELRYESYLFISLLIVIFTCYILPNFIFTDVEDNAVDVIIQAFKYPYILLGTICLLFINLKLLESFWKKIKSEAKNIEK